MKYYILTKNRLPIGTPFDEQYLLKTYGNQIPNNVEQINFVSAPQLKPYEKNQTVIYQRLNDGVISCIWSCEKMTEQEKNEKQNLIKSVWAVDGYKSWIFEEETCSFVPPVPYPTDGKSYYWDEPTLSWVQNTGE